MAAASVLLAVSALLTGCDTKVVTAPATAAGGAADGAVCGDIAWPTGGAQPPDSPADAPPVQSGNNAQAPKVLAIFELAFPDASPDAWKTMGYNLDGVDGAEVCEAVVSAAPSPPHQDGNDGIDNAFGHTIVPLLQELVFDLSETATDAIWAGAETHLFVLAHEPHGASNATSFTTKLYRTADLGVAAQFDGSDAWPVRSDSLEQTNDIESARTELSCAYISNDTWVSGELVDLDLAIALASDIGNATLTIPIRDAIISMAIDSSNIAADHGIIAGVVPTEEFLDAMAVFVGNLDPTVCDSDALDALNDQIRASADMGAAGQACDGVSIGIHFRASEAKLGGVMLAPAPPTDPCEDASAP